MTTTEAAPPAEKKETPKKMEVEDADMTPSTPTKKRSSTVGKAEKKKRPMTQKRIEQLQAARAKHSANAAARRQQRGGGKESKYESRRQEQHSSRLVREDGEAADRYLDVLKSESPDMEVSKSERSESKHSGKKRKVDTTDLDSLMPSPDTLKVVAGLAVGAAAVYVAGKNMNTTALRAGFSSHGSAIPGDSSTGVPAIPVQSIIAPDIPRYPASAGGSGTMPQVPSLGFWSS